MGEWISVKERLPEEGKEVRVKFRCAFDMKEYCDTSTRYGIYWDKFGTPEVPWFTVLAWKPIE